MRSNYTKTLKFLAKSSLRTSYSNRSLAGLLVVVVSAIILLVPVSVAAISPPNQIPDPQPIPGSYGLAATKTQPAPTSSATITTPGNGSSFSNSPITVGGICTNGLIVEIFDNGVFVGSVTCSGHSFSLKVSLFTGKNVLQAIQYDELGQASPKSNQVTVNYHNANFAAFGQLITLTSDYGRRAANPGDTLSWPLKLSGGTGPYAFSIDWGDNQSAALKSVASAGNVTIDHVYDRAGIYVVTIRVTDTNGVSAFLQVVAVANGKPVAGAGHNQNGGTKVIVRVLWIPALILLLLLIPAFWLGRRSELVSLHRKLEKDMNEYHES